MSFSNTCSFVNGDPTIPTRTSRAALDSINVLTHKTEAGHFVSTMRKTLGTLTEHFGVALMIDPKEIAIRNRRQIVKDSVADAVMLEPSLYFRICVLSCLVELANTILPYYNGGARSPGDYTLELISCTAPYENLLCRIDA